MEPHKLDPAISDKQGMLDRAVHGLLKSKGVFESNGATQAYEEFVRYDEVDPKKGEILRLVFVALTNGGVKLEGEPYPWADSDAHEAIEGYIFQLTRYLGGCRHLRWRHRPVIECSPNHRDTWTVYSRLAVHT